MLRCARCETELTETDDAHPVVLDRGYGRKGREFRPLCVACGDAIRWQRPDWDTHCAGCGRAIRVHSTKRHYGAKVWAGERYGFIELPPPRNFCSAECRVNAHKLARRIKPHGARPCLGCDRDFTPTRDDALTCSDTCRQRVHRRQRR